MFLSGWDAVVYVTELLVHYYIYYGRVWDVSTACPSFHIDISQNSEIILFSVTFRRHLRWTNTLTLPAFTVSPYLKGTNHLCRCCLPCVLSFEFNSVRQFKVDLLSRFGIHSRAGLLCQLSIVCKSLYSPLYCDRKNT